MIDEDVFDLISIIDTVISCDRASFPWFIHLPCLVHLEWASAWRGGHWQWRGSEVDLSPATALWKMALRGTHYESDSEYFGWWVQEYWCQGGTVSDWLLISSLLNTGSQRWATPYTTEHWPSFGCQVRKSNTSNDLGRGPWLMELSSGDFSEMPFLRLCTSDFSLGWLNESIRLSKDLSTERGQTPLLSWTSLDLRWVLNLSLYYDWLVSSI